jgi:hypothetical protein
VVGVFVSQDDEAPDPAGDRVLGHRGVGEPAEFVEGGLGMVQPQPSRDEKVLWDVLTEHLQCPLHAGCDLGGGLGGAVVVGVAEGGGLVSRGSRLVVYPVVLPSQRGVGCPESGEQRDDGLWRADHDPLGVGDLAGFGGDAQPAGGADQGEGGFRARAADFQGGGAVGFGQ